MLNTRFIRIAGAMTMAAVLAGTTGCQNLPGDGRTQGAVIGGLGGAAAGAAIGGDDKQVLGALIGGVLGAGGGYVIGANADRIKNSDRTGAQRAHETAQTRPATVEDARTATTADLNSDGFVTLDEVVALERAGLSDQRIVDHLRATGQVFELTPEQEQHLRSQGVSEQVVAQMREINRQTREQLLNQSSSGVISRPQ